jgi:class 3 adenylate cyclase
MNESDKSHDLFQKEHELIDHARSLLDSLKPGNKIDPDEYSIILKSFIKILKQFSKVIKIHDRQQHEITILSDKLTNISSRIACYIPYQVYQVIFSNENEDILKPERKKMTVFFADIINFSELTQDLEPEALSLAMNTYLMQMFNIAKEYGGTIDKTIGDAILIFFGAPTSMGEKEDALACVKMAIAMRKAIHNLENIFLQMGIINTIKVRMAMSSGYCTVGNFGSSDRMDYTAIGTPVNLSNRLQTIADSNQILITHEIYTWIKNDVYCEKKDTVQVKGFRTPIVCYEVHDLLENINNPDDISQFFDGFSIYFNKNSVEKDKSEEIIKTLKKVLKSLKEDG